MLNVIVVGGGIAGLATAVSLRRAGHQVHIYERSSFNNEIGAAIHMASNASRALLAWGLDPGHARFVIAKSGLWAMGNSLETFREADFTFYEEHFGAPWFLTHRVDLHAELKRLATGKGSGFSVTTHLNTEVVAYCPDDPSITLADGSVVSADVIIAADGVHSLGVEAILGQPNPPHPQELYNLCYRFLIPSSVIERDAQTRFWNQGDDGRIKFYVGKNKRLVSYPCRNNEVHNFVAIFHEDGNQSLKREDWQASVDKSKLKALFSDFHPSLLAVLEKADDVKQWPLLYREPIRTWVKGKMALAGDAAHPMLPHQGQGGAQGIEDGVALGIVLANATIEDIPQRLALYEAIRRPRASAMQIFSNAGQDEAGLIQKEAAKYMAPEKVPRNPDEFQEFNLGYDVIRHSIQELQRLDPSFNLPPDFFHEKPGRGRYP